MIGTVCLCLAIGFVLGALAMAGFLAYVHSEPNIRLPW